MARQVSTVPTLTRRSGVYYANWYDAAERRTRRLSLATRDEGEARARFGAFLVDGKDNGRNKASGVVLAGEVIDAYLTEHVERRARSAARIRSAIGHCREAFATRDISTMVEEDFEEYADRRRRGDIGGASVDSTIIYELGLFRAAVSHGISRKRIDGRATPLWWTPERPAVKCDKWLTRAEIDALIGAAASRRVENFIHIAYWTAGRHTAVLHTQADRVDMDRLRLDLHFPEWKRTKKRNATVPILGDLENVLTGLLMFKSGPDFLLDSTRPIRPEWVATVERARLAEKGVTPHWLRHSRATHLLQAGKTLFHVAGLLGDTTATVERIYGHHCADNLREHLA